MATDTHILVKGLKRLSLTVLLMFTAPIILFEAFKNQQHPMYYPVLIAGILLAIGAIISGFTGIKIVVDSFFGKRPTRN
ncbi:MAG: hypothetical protein RLZZ241_2538 [Bacteroidota bacterium]|jgi:hypothetical protein